MSFLFRDQLVGRAFFVVIMVNDLLPHSRYKKPIPLQNTASDPLLRYRLREMVSIASFPQIHTEITKYQTLYAVCILWEPC